MGMAKQMYSWSNVCTHTHTHTIFRLKHRQQQSFYSTFSGQLWWPEQEMTSTHTIITVLPNTPDQSSPITVNKSIFIFKLAVNTVNQADYFRTQDYFQRIYLVSTSKIKLSFLSVI